MPGRYRLRDALIAPGLLSLARLPLAACFPFVADRPVAALAVLVLAGLTDVLDGRIARRTGQVTPTGVVLDGITDKAFALTVAITLVADGYLSVLAMLLLNVREIAEAPLVLRYAMSAEARRMRTVQTGANVAGKAATVLQFVAIAFALFRSPQTAMWVAATAAVGAFAAFTYWRRALAAPGTSRAAPHA